jgi:hypothetical protein
MTLATVEVGRFEFTAVGRDEIHADALLLGAWKRHRRSYPDADGGLMQAVIMSGDVRYVTVEIGTVLRDGEAI